MRIQALFFASLRDEVVEDALKLEVAVGDRVKAGSSVLARYESP